MGSVRYVILAIAAVVAIGLALVVRALVSHPAPPPAAAAPPPKPMAQVVVARHDLPIGTRLGPNDLAWQPWPVEALNPAYITDGRGGQQAPATTGAAVAQKVAGAASAAQAVVTGSSGPMDALYGAIVRQPILANEPVVNTKLVRAGQSGYMAVVLDPGMRAVAVPIKDSSAAGGFILPGDRVDVLQVTQQQSGSGPAVAVAKTLVRNVRVLAIDQTTQADKKTSIIGATATLEVPADDVAAISTGHMQDNIVLVLRSYADASGPPSGAVQMTSNVVHIFRDGQSTDVTVTQ